MYKLINSILLEFRNCFKRERTWRWFAVLVFGFMIRRSHRGVTSTISGLRLDPSQYHKMLHFYRSAAYTVEELYDRWAKIVVRNASLTEVSGRIVLIGDHSKVPKEGRKMPDIEILHQDSQNAGKAEYIAGHNYGQVSAVITNGNVSRSIPLMTQLQKSPPRIEGTKKPDGDTLVTQMLNLVHKAALSIEKPTVVALDAYFCKQTAWEAADKTIDETGQRRVEIVTRAPSDTVAYMTPKPPTEKKRGKPRKYGEKIAVYPFFSNTSLFTTTEMNLYGEKTEVKYFCQDLLWMPVKKLVRFVWLKTKRGCIVLMSSSLTLSAEEIIAVYGLRFKIETSFNEQKHDIGCFSYHFWTTAMPKRKKWKKAEVSSDLSLQGLIFNAQKAVQAYVCLSTIAVGILSIIAFSYNRVIWQRYQGWVRTLRSTIPSVSIVRETLAQDYLALSRHLPALDLFNIIRPLRRFDLFFFKDVV